MEQGKKKKKEVIKKLKNKFRLVVINDDTFEERFSILLSPINVFTLTGLLGFLFTSAIVATIAFTPLRELIPGYSDINTKKMAQKIIFEFKIFLDRSYFFFDVMESGPPLSIIPKGFRPRSSFLLILLDFTTLYTPDSLTLLAISWVYCEPKSIIKTKLDMLI